MRRILLGLAAALVGLGGLSTGAHAASAVDGVRVALEPTNTSMTLGESIDLALVVSNDGSGPTGPLVLHLDVTDPERSTSVDPEDWTSTLTKPIGVVGPGATARADWTVQPVSGGTYVVYAVVLSAGADRLAASNVARVVVADRRSLNPSGILPVAVGAPLIVGLLLLVQLRLARRAQPRGPAGPGA